MTKTLELREQEIIGVARQLLRLGAQDTGLVLVKRKPPTDDTWDEGDTLICSASVEDEALSYIDTEEFGILHGMDDDGPYVRVPIRIAVERNNFDDEIEAVTKYLKLQVTD